MASATAKKLCIKCSKGLGQVICDGCQHYFCLKHLNEHRQELSQKLHDVTLEYDQLQQNILDKDSDRQHPLMNRINRWEMKSTEKIKQIANKVRQELRESLDRSKKNIKESLHIITDELRENQHMSTFTETDLTRWMSQLKELREKFDKPPMIEIKHDEDKESSTHIPLIQLQIIQQRKGKCSV